MKNLFLTTALALIASPTLADITPEELWQSWQETSSHFGASLTAGSESREGAVLILRDVTSTIDFGFVRLEQVISQIELEALEHGSVSVTFDSNISGTGSFNLDNAPQQSMFITGQLEGAQGVVTGTANDYIYDFSIGHMQMAGTMEVGEAGGVQGQAKSIASYAGLNGKIHYTASNEGMNIEYSFTLDRLENTQDTSNPIGSSERSFKQSQHSTAEEYRGDVSLFLPAGSALSANQSFIPEGFTMAADVNIGHMNITQKTSSPYFNMDIGIDQQDMGISIAVDGQNISLATSGKATSFTLGMPALGSQPYHTEFEDAAFALTLPYRLSDTPQEAQFTLSLGGVSVSDSIWALADPENTLSRAPADFAISAKFLTTLLLDWTNIEAVKSWDEAPSILHQVALETFLVSFENAMLEGEGVVDFSNETEVPMPNGGALSFTLTGIPALLEKLGGLPLVDPSIAAQASGMLGMFTSAGEDGSLNSNIEFGEGGQVSINGQKIR